MNLEIVKESYKQLSEAMSFKSFGSFKYPAIGWYFSAEELDNSFVFEKDKWVCMFMYLKLVINKGKRIRFSGDYGSACSGPAELFGFQELSGSDGKFIAETERFKKTRELARDHYEVSLASIRPPKEKYLYMEKLENMDGDKEIEVVNLFPDVTALACLGGLSHYDRGKDMPNVLTPCASGCQSAFTIPYNEKFQTKPKSVIGVMEPLVRKIIPEDMVSFSVPSNRFVEMANNIKGSFLEKDFISPLLN